MIAITGGIAEGKSTVLGMLGELGYRTSSADEIARDVFAEATVHRKLQSLFEMEELSRDAIRIAISNKPELRREMNRIMHGPIWERVVASSSDFVEIPLLVEACLHFHFRRVWMVTCGAEEQLRRLAERLGSDQAAEQLLSTQLSSRVKAQFADRIVRTNAELGSVLAFVSSAAKVDVAR